MGTYGTEAAERKAAGRSTGDLVAFTAEQVGDEMTITLLLKKRGSSSKWPKLKLVTTLSGEKYFLKSASITYGK